jgi:hypothetical protein
MMSRGGRTDYMFSYNQNKSLQKSSNISIMNTSINSTNSNNQYRIALICDFFFPRLGGVETHIFQLALGIN